MNASRCLPLERRTRLVRLLGMLGSDHAGEVANAGAMANRLVTEAGLTWDSVVGERSQAPAEEPRRQQQTPPQAWREMATEILESGRATKWETGFCEDLLEHWRSWDLTEKQQAVLDRIFAQRVRPNSRD